ncbi:FAD/NAD(P)-binding protein [Streptacidiphilus anmyonensis]|uniref:FAD/NAD(P)-binding protein n=1 Tax=Streptacidiphilus anmyonensis TaxID=405782 RepID=UPI0005A6279E|nr:FAD/NAD(P)-binding protein [Streptacidiphilus anmyonensis]
MFSGELRVCVVGAGPRGLSVLERLCANERARRTHRSVAVHVVDPFPPGGGRVWRTTQSRDLLMNTVAAQVTVFTDDSVEMEGPVERGPSLYEWARSSARRSAGRVDPGGPAAEILAEARALGPDDYPRRSFYGHYLRFAFDRVVSRAPGHVVVTVHRTLAVALNESGPDGGHTLTLADGTRLTGLDAVVLAQGHVPARPTEQEARTARAAEAHGLAYLLPANPADVDLSAVRAGQPVVLRGLGLNFFDYMALLTVGRGGEFVRRGDRLAYRPSGQEPLIHAGSRRGVPYHSRGDNEKGAHGRYTPRLLTAETIAALRRRALDGAEVTFGADVWPLIRKEVESVYYGTLLAAEGRDGQREEFVDRFLAAPRGAAEEALLDVYGIGAGRRWDWRRIADPQGQAPIAGREEFRAWLLAYLADDVREARAGNVSGPLKAALDSLRDLRNEVRLVVDHGGLDGASYREELRDWYTPLNAFVSIGPPVSRTAELIALMEAGIVQVLGPGLRIRIDEDAPSFVAESSRVGGEPVRAAVLIEARLPEPDLRRTADPLLAHMLATGRCRPYHMRNVDGSAWETGGLAVTRRPYRVVRADGLPHRRLFAYGVPTESVHWVTAAGIRPGVNSVTLGDSDAIARAVLALGRAGAEPPGGLSERSDSDLTGVAA